MCPEAEQKINSTYICIENLEVCGFGAQCKNATSLFKAHCSSHFIQINIESVMYVIFQVNHVVTLYFAVCTLNYITYKH